MKKSRIGNETKVASYVNWDSWSTPHNDSVHPTDMDGLIELNNEVLVLFEFKEEGKDIITGQKTALERIADSWDTSVQKDEYGKKIQKKSYVLKCEHPPVEGVEIKSSDAKVTSIYMCGQWNPLKQPVPVDSILTVIVDDFYSKNPKLSNLVIMNNARPLLNKI